MDILSDILRDLHMHSAVLSIGEFCTPWGVEKGTMRGAPFHMLFQGRCLLQVEDDDAIELTQGDLVVLPHGDRHALLSHASAPRTPFIRVLEANGLDGTWAPNKRLQRLDRLRFGGGGELTRIVNGVFAFQDRRRNPLLEALPKLIHVRGHKGRGTAWLEGPLSLLIDELASGRPGFQTIAERMMDILFVQAVRDYIASLPTHKIGWLRGLTDPQIAQVLSQIHVRPGESWTVASLAKVAGLSRTVFAHRFRSLVGSSVMEYVSSRRMYVAAGLLANSAEALPEIANEVGYESEISFSKAFRRWGGVPPGKYRRSMMETIIKT